MKMALLETGGFQHKSAAGAYSPLREGSTDRAIPWIIGDGLGPHRRRGLDHLDQRNLGLGFGFDFGFALALAFTAVEEGGLWV